MGSVAEVCRLTAHSFHRQFLCATINPYTNYEQQERKKKSRISPYYFFFFYHFKHFSRVYTFMRGSEAARMELQKIRHCRSDPDAIHVMADGTAKSKEQMDAEKCDQDKLENMKETGLLSWLHKGCFLTYGNILFLFIMLSLAAISAVVVTYNFGTCANINVQSEVCDKKNVIPITIGINSTQPIAEEAKKVAVRFEEDLHRSNRTSVRLPKTMHPITYELKLIPFLFEGNFTFNGEARIVVNVTIACRNITLHATALKITDVTVWKMGTATQTDIDRTEIEVTDKFIRDPDQFFIIVFADELEPNNTYEIYIKYTGILNDMLQGFYRSSYEMNNVTR